MVRGSAKGDDTGKIFVGGLAVGTNEDDLQEYFSKYGVVIDSIVMKDADKITRKFGFVTFKDPTSVEQVLADKPHILGGKTIDPKQAVPRGPGQPGPPPPVRGGGGGGGGGGSGSDMNKIFVGGLPQNISEDGLMNFFSTFGKVVGAQLIHDKESGKMRGFGFVTFASPDSVKMAADTRYHQINGKTVETKRVEEKGRGRGGMHMNQRNPLATPIHGGGMHGAFGPPVQYGQFPQGPGPYGQQGPQMGRGYNSPGGFGYGAPGQPMAPGGAPGFGAAPPSAGYGYAGMPTAGMPTAGYDPAGYGRGAPQARDAAGAMPYGNTAYGVAPGSGGAPPPVAPAGAGGFEQYSQMPATSSALPTPGGGAPPRVEATPGPPDYAAYSSYGLGSSYQQQDSQYGPARNSLESPAGYTGYGVGAGTETAYSTAGAGPGAGAGAGGFEAAGPFGRGGGNVSRGYHPYGR